MKILMISDVFFPRINGVSTSIKTFCRSLQRLGHEITLIAPDYNGNNNIYRENDEAIEVIRIPSRKVIFDPEDRLLKKQKLKSLCRELDVQQFDVIHIQTPFIAHQWGVRLSKQFNIPCVESYHTYFEEYFYHYIPFMPRVLLKATARWLTRKQCNRVTSVIVPSTAMQKVLTDYGVHADIQIIPTGLDLKLYKSDPSSDFRQRYDLGDDKPMILHVGRIAHEKNISFLLRVISHLKQQLGEFVFVIAGEGPALNSIKDEARRLKVDDCVRFIGYLDRQTELMQCYAAADLFIFASRTETQGLVLLESMAMGTPVVSTAEMGTKDILTPRRGCLIADEDIEDFCDKIIDVLQNKILRDRLSAEARIYVREWTDDTMASQLQNYYQQLLEMKRTQIFQDMAA